MERTLPYDDVAWEHSDKVVGEWTNAPRKRENLQAIATLVASHHGGKPVEVKPPRSGAFNVMQYCSGVRPWQPRCDETAKARQATKTALAARIIEHSTRFAVSKDRGEKPRSRFGELLPNTGAYTSC
ncbi:hypothetical protein IWX90DRAFT_82665 [Phyllosticta citrichinensis]|uniref:Uncharacterized protein n=1 Tax=Phyllosticta citrichinensis TaxID=1130410 RepID=A0ABR1XGG0_9PEZI